MDIQSIAIIVALIMSIVFHEMAHGYAANWLGDPTARLSGRLTANPLAHIDPLGSVILPAILFLGGAHMLFGWAKPVPYNPYNLRNQKWGEALVALAGPVSNIVLAIVFALLIRLAPVLDLSIAFVTLSLYVVYINILLACFNLIPIPPLDGSKILPAILPLSLSMRYRNFVIWAERYGIFVAFAFIFLFMTVFWKPFAAFVYGLLMLLTGASF